MKQLLQTLFFFLLITQISFAQWYQQNIPIYGAWANSVCFTDEVNGYVVGKIKDSLMLNEDGVIYRTTDGGTTWIVTTLGPPLYDVSFTVANQGAVVGFGYHGFGQIFITTDGGRTWGPDTIFIADVPLVGVSFKDIDNGIAVGYSGRILRTSNGGKNWSYKSSGSTAHLYGISFIYPNIAIAVGDSGTILRTTDDGVTWSLKTSGVTSPLNKVSLTDSITGTAVGDSGTILRTTDGGITWTKQTSGLTRDLKAVSFVSSIIGTVVGDSGTIIRTTNGGITWINQLSGTNNHLYGVSFTNGSTGTAVGEKMIILHTTNGGVVPVELNSLTATANGKEVTLNWSTATELNNQGFEVQRKFSDNNFVSIGSVRGNGTTTSPNNYTFVDKLIDAGKYFYRLKQIDFGGKYEYSQTVEINWSPFTTYKLEQNYPNPFNPTTTIGFGIPEEGNVRLSVLNILGEEIKILINEEKEAGYHSIDFKGNDVPSGVYFYRLKAGSFVGTKKMILLR